MEHTQCPLVENDHLTAMANRQDPTEVIGGDTVNGTLEGVPPSYMVRFALLGQVVTARASPL